MRALELLPAIDIKNGKSVRLKQADLDSAEQYENPNVVLSDFVAKGAKWVHLVDLDAAFQSGSNSELIQELISVSPIKIQLSGGIINENTLQKALSTKADRINIATAALQNIDWVVKAIKSNNERLMIGLDINDGVLVARGSGEVIGEPFEYIKTLDMAGCKRYVVTDNSTDGELSGPNLDLLDKVLKSTKSLIIASGGISKLSDLKDLREMGLDGVIVGKALYVGAIEISAAIKTCYQ
jgi:phosphoribosylformimino-5-aminoimidazole carboxamide ribotide isomerase